MPAIAKRTRIPMKTLPPKTKATGERKRETDGRFAGSEYNADGGTGFETDGSCAVRKSNGQPVNKVKSKVALADQAVGGADRVETEKHDAAYRLLQERQRKRAQVIKLRVKIDNGLSALIAQRLGDGGHLNDDPGARKALRKRADALIKSVCRGLEVAEEDRAVAEDMLPIIVATWTSREGYAKWQANVEKQMLVNAEQLPESAKAFARSVRGFGSTTLLSLAVIVGECGDLSNYDKPGKLWKRLGLAPITSGDGVTQMGSTWKSKGGLRAEEWTKAGYNPRRRSICYLLGEGIVKQNDGEFRKRYDDVKKDAAAKHPDWSKKRCHLHAMLLATKRLIRELWCAWNPDKVRRFDMRSVTDETGESTD